MTLTGKTGIVYRLNTTPIGGEGDIFHAYITKVSKIYKPGVMTRELENKLKIMIENPPNESVMCGHAYPVQNI